MSDAKQATPAAELERQICSATEPKNEREWWSHYEIARLRAELTAERERADRAEEERDVLRNNQLGPISEGPLKALGAWVADHTDDDTWPAAEQYLNAALAERDELRERLREMSRAAEALKRPCGMDPESSQARRNLEYQDVANIGWRAALEGK